MNVANTTNTEPEIRYWRIVRRDGGRYEALPVTPFSVASMENDDRRHLIVLGTEADARAVADEHERTIDPAPRRNSWRDALASRPTRRPF